MRQIVYFRTAAGRQDAIVIASILAASRDRNLRDRITGLLIAGGHRYLQVIEGPDAAILALMLRLRRDERHVGLTVLVDRAIGSRMFDDWSMAYAGEPRLNEFATFRDLVHRLRTMVADRSLWAQIDCLADRFALSPIGDRAEPWALAAQPA